MLFVKQNEESVINLEFGPAVVRSLCQVLLGVKEGRSSGAHQRDAQQMQRSLPPRGSKGQAGRKGQHLGEKQVPGGGRV